MNATLENLILQTLVEGPAHGYSIAVRLERAEGGVLEHGEGAIYSALYHLLEGGLITATRGGSGKGGAPRIYALTERGRSRTRQADS